MIDGFILKIFAVMAFVVAVFGDNELIRVMWFGCGIIAYGFGSIMGSDA